MTRSPDEWDLAPCGLLEVDGRRIVVRANEQFLARTGYTRADVDDGLSFTSLLTPAGRIFYETQLAPMLALNGRVEELMLEIVCPGGRRLPVLVTAEQSRADRSPDGERTRLALMSVPDRQEYERRLRNAQHEAEVANDANAQVRKRLELLAGANSALASSVDVRAALRRLARLLVGEVADWCLVYTVDPDLPNQLPHWAAAHVDPSRQADLDRLAPLLPRHASEGSVLRKVGAGAAPVVLPDVTRDALRAMTTSTEVIDLVTALGVRSALVVPSTAHAQQAALLVLVRGPERPAFTDEDLTQVVDLAERTGTAIDNLRLYARARAISVGLQKALLTPLPAHAALEIVSRYAPGANGSEVGGDWYDAFEQANGATAVVVGDVVGHDLDAAAAMGHLRGVIRTIGYTRSGTPAQTLAEADRAAAGLQLRVIASAVLATLRQVSPGTFAVQWSSAGHPPPVLVRRNGTAEVLNGTPDVLLGVLPASERSQLELQMHAGDTLVLYTDGLIERRDEDLDLSIARLAADLTGGAQLSLPELCDRILDRRPRANEDDVAVLAVRVAPTSD
ncbi:MAG: SpoIIE family protein phosphatase [Jatrophihabitans sp.]|uniref:SpoIIE family protein phosphatase n=1 Tax=Jatrophihabitans sp. TaxID=1932789 RepID=UPI0039133BFD